MVLTIEFVRLGLTEKTRAATPDTCGVTIDVPTQIQPEPTSP
jgi:hypothetical protein